MDQKDPHRYDSILDLPHPVSRTHPQMPEENRAAQFSPFAALVGYEEQIEEAARQTDCKVELDEQSRELLDRKLRLLQEHIAERPEISVTYFLPDQKKAGGRYACVSGRVKRINAGQDVMLLTDGTGIPISELYSVESEFFCGLEDEFA